MERADLMMIAPIKGTKERKIPSYLQMQKKIDNIFLPLCEGMPNHEPTTLFV